MTRNPAEDAPARVAVVTVSFGSREVLGPFLASVRAASAAPSIVVIADNKPDEESGVEDQAHSAGADYVALPQNLGYGAAMNSAAARLPASIEWILISNPDVVLGPDSIDVLVRAGDQDPLIGAVGPAILTEDGQVYPSARTVPSLRTGVGHALFADLWVANPWTRAYRREAVGTPHRREAGWLSGACLLVRRSTFDGLGGFDPAYFMYFEDVDLGYRIGRAGFTNIYEPAATVTHTGAHSTTGESERMIEAHHVSARRFLIRKYPGPVLWPVRATLTVGLALRSAVVRRRRISRKA